MPDWVKLIGGGFAHLDAPFAVHPHDERRAREYRGEAQAAGLDWPTVESHLNTYADAEGWNADKRAAERRRVREFMGM